MSESLLQSHEDVLEARVRVFSALGDETRLRIFQTLIESDDPLHVSAICEETNLSPNLVSHHLQCLANCTFVEVEQEGRKRFYEVTRPEAVEMLQLADECIRQDVENVLDCEIVSTDDETE
jgi:DNA-binding transcriptional ArsR family regulator